jgi:hypothetical protein
MDKHWDAARDGRDVWIATMSALYVDALRVLKPGAHALVWTIPRTSHWTATALEDAGFEIRDVVTHLFGTGFPKSRDVSKAIDKAAGAERSVVGRYQPPNGSTWNLTHDESVPGDSGKTMGTFQKRSASLDVTAPGPADAERFDGYGTALKPAAEHWILARKPLSEQTVTSNVLRWGTGALNIDGCRIGVSKSVPASPRGAQDRIFGRYAAQTGRESGHNPSIGRWPANVVLTHTLFCRQVGTKQIASNGHYPAQRGVGGLSTTGHSGQAELDERSTVGELVEAWECADDCPVRLLDEQSGNRPGFASGGQRKRGAQRSIFQRAGGDDRHSSYHADTGGASRFFYTAKASRKERRESKHPTIKSVALMRWLVRLVSPPGPIVVLDMFAGSGATIEACIQEGVHCIAIERERESIDDCLARVSDYDVELTLHDTMRSDDGTSAERDDSAYDASAHDASLSELADAREGNDTDGTA